MRTLIFLFFFLFSSNLFSQSNYYLIGEVCFETGEIHCCCYDDSGNFIECKNCLTYTIRHTCTPGGWFECHSFYNDCEPVWDAGTCEACCNPGGPGYASGGCCTEEGGPIPFGMP